MNKKKLTRARKAPKSRTVSRRCAVATGSALLIARPYWTPPFRYDHDMSAVVDVENTKIVDVRGWGHLTGRGAWALTDEHAESIQRAIGESVAQHINASWPNTTMSHAHSNNATAPSVGATTETAGPA